LSAHPTQATTIHVPADQPSIQAGIDAAADEDLVLVAPGAYVENIDFLGKAISLRATHGPVSTFLLGNQQGSVVTFASGETSASVIEGFTIRNGHGDDGSSDGGGGGILCWNASPTISSCVVRSNTTRSNGGGIACLYSDPMIMNCTLDNNTSKMGGGISCSHASPTITNCVLSYNKSAHFGGGISCDASSPIITNCTIIKNSSSQRFLMEEFGIGGGISATTNSFPTVLNSIIWDNEALLYGDSIDVTQSSHIDIIFSDVEGGWPGIGNIDISPHFVSSWEYQLSDASPCIDAGADAEVYRDLDGNVRPYGSGFDIGAYEFISDLTLVSSPSYSEGILELDFHVGMLEPAIWSTSLVVTSPSVHFVPLWTMPLQVIIDPPIAVPLSHEFPSVGWIVILSSLRSGSTISLFDFDWVDTGS